MDAAPDLLALYEAKALAELSDAEASAGVGPGSWSGDALGAVALVVGAPPAADGAPLSPETTAALDKALAAMKAGTLKTCPDTGCGVAP